MNHLNVSPKINGHHTFSFILEKNVTIIPFSEIGHHIVTFWK